jgi:hypothetical protein
MTAPDGSATVPDIEDEPLVWADACPDENAITRLKKNKAGNERRAVARAFEKQYNCELLDIASSNFDRLAPPGRTATRGAVYAESETRV